MFDHLFKNILSNSRNLLLEVNADFVRWEFLERHCLELEPPKRAQMYACTILWWALTRITGLSQYGMSASFLCSYYPEGYSAPSKALLLSHIRLTHSNDTNFTIQCSSGGCSRTFTNFRTYQNHRWRHRVEMLPLPIEDSANDFSDESTGTSTNNTSPHHSPAAVDIQRLTAKWILKTRETRSLTWAATQGVIEGVHHLVSFVTHTLESQTHSVLRTCGIDPSSVPGLDNVFHGPVTKPFEGLKSSTSSCSIAALTSVLL